MSKVVLELLVLEALPVVAEPPVVLPLTLALPVLALCELLLVTLKSLSLCTLSLLTVTELTTLLEPVPVVSMLPEGSLLVEAPKLMPLSLAVLLTVAEVEALLLLLASPLPASPPVVLPLTLALPL